MSQELNLLKKRLDVAAKREKADVVLKKRKIIDVFNLEIIEADVAIVDGFIVGIGQYDGHQIIDVGQQYICPGFIDGHVHIESSMVTPLEFAKVVVPHGVTTVIADPHEIANVAGIAGIEYMLKASADIPLNVYFMLPSCVPATPFENAGATLLNEDLLPLYEHPRVLGLGEVMDFPAVFHTEQSMLDKIATARQKEKVIDGHAAGVDADGINVYRTAGIASDHECVTAQEAKDRLQRGMYVMLREGSVAKDLKELLKAVNEKNARRCLFVTDDKHLDDLLNQGSIDYNVRCAIESGLDPLVAIQIATLNAAEYFGLQHKGAIAPGYHADFLILNDLETIYISQVYLAGKLVAENKNFISSDYTISLSPTTLSNSIHLPTLTTSNLQIPIHHHLAHVIGLIPNSLVTKHLQIEVSVDEQGYFQPSVEEDLLKLVVAERHNQTGNIGLGIIQGLQISSGAMASTVAHDSHNLVVAGTTDSDILFAMEEMNRMGGGIVVVQNEQVLASLSLPIAGLMADRSYQVIYQELVALNESLIEIGFKGDFNPFLTLSFLALPVIPELKLTDLGLFDVLRFQHIPISKN